MESTRQQKIERLIQKDLSDIFLRYARALHSTLISVSEVRISPDLSIAHVYLSIFPQDKVASTIEQGQAITRNAITLLISSVNHQQTHAIISTVGV